MSNIKKIKSYIPKSTDVFLFDTNVWLYLYCPIGNYNRYVTEAYSVFLAKVLTIKSQIVVPAQVVSEFFNVYIKLEFERKKYLAPSKFQSFKKDFRNTHNYNDTIQEISSLIKDKILKYSTPTNDFFDELEISTILDGNNFDFNDKYFQELSRYNSYKIVTNDKDMLNCSDVEIISTQTK